MQKLAQVLAQFNRKERNLLVRAIQGDEEKPLELAGAFVCDLIRVLSPRGTRRENPWWATDYHISWLAGALAYYTEGDACLKSARCNRSSTRSVKDKEIESRLIEGNQEDIDLVIASGLDLILIEAKAYGSWDNEQLQSKFDRLDLLFREYQDIAGKAKIAEQDRVKFHFLLMSPRESKNITAERPKWMGEKLLWIKLQLPPRRVLEATRCDKNGKTSQNDDYWHIIEHRTKQGK